MCTYPWRTKTRYASAMNLQILKKRATGHRPCRRVRQLPSCAATWRTSWRCSSRRGDARRGDARRHGGASPAWRCFAGRRSSSAWTCSPVVGPRWRGGARRRGGALSAVGLVGVEVLAGRRSSSAWRWTPWWRCSPAVVEKAGSMVEELALMDEVAAGRRGGGGGEEDREEEEIERRRKRGGGG